MLLHLTLSSPDCVALVVREARQRRQEALEAEPVRLRLSAAVFERSCCRFVRRASRTRVSTAAGVRLEERRTRLEVIECRRQPGVGVRGAGRLAVARGTPVLHRLLLRLSSGRSARAPGPPARRRRAEASLGRRRRRRRDGRQGTRERRVARRAERRLALRRSRLLDKSCSCNYESIGGGRQEPHEGPERGGPRGRRTRVAQERL